MRLERRQRLARLPSRALELWPRPMRVGTGAAATLLLVVTAFQIAYTILAVASLATEYRLPAVAIAELSFYQFTEPLLVFFCGAWLLAGALTGKVPSRFIRLLALAGTGAGFLLSGMGQGIHELSHLVGDECDSYTNTIALFLMLSLASCGTMLVRPLVGRLFPKPGLQR